MVCELKSFPKIVNYVCTVDFHTNQDPRRIAMYTPNATRSSSHSPRFPALRIHVKDSIKQSKNMMTLNFAGGSMVITGAFTYYTALRDAQRRRLYVEDIPQPFVVLDKDNYPVRIELRRIGILTEFRYFRPVNIVGNGIATPYQISLARIMSAYPDESKHQPLNFPALKYDLKPSKWPGVTVKTAAHIFDTGKNVIMGGKSMHQMHVSQQCIEHLADPFYDSNAPTTPKGRYEHRLRALREVSREVRSHMVVRSFLHESEDVYMPPPPPVRPSGSVSATNRAGDGDDGDREKEGEGEGEDDALTNVVDRILSTMW